MMMKVQILVATMNQTDYSKLDEINVQTECIVINQCDHNKQTKINYKGNSVLWIDTVERGLSRSRNMALDYATGDICLLVDDDEILVNNYEKIILEGFESIKTADLLTFNIRSVGNVRQRYENTNIKRLHFYNIMRYGSARIAFRRECIEKNMIRMDVRFGAGSLISSGEDSIFLSKCLKSGMRAYAYPGLIADINDNTSTWFSGYTDTYFRNIGTVFAAMSPRWSNLWIAQYLIRHSNVTKEIGMKRSLVLMLKGKNDLKKLNNSIQ